MAEDQVVVSSDYDSTHEANHSDSSDVAHTEEDREEGKSSTQNVILHQLIPPEVAEGHTHTTKTQSFTQADNISSHNTGQTDSGSRAALNGGLGAMDESAQQLELPHFHLDGEHQWEVWTDPESGETTVKCCFVGFFLFVLGNSKNNLEKRLS